MNQCTQNKILLSQLDLYEKGPLKRNESLEQRLNNTGFQVIRGAQRILAVLNVDDQDDNNTVYKLPIADNKRLEYFLKVKREIAPSVLNKGLEKNRNEFELSQAYPGLFLEPVYEGGSQSEILQLFVSEYISILLSMQKNREPKFIEESDLDDGILKASLIAQNNNAPLVGERAEFFLKRFACFNTNVLGGMLHENEIDAKNWGYNAYGGIRLLNYGSPAWKLVLESHGDEIFEMVQRG